MVYRPCWDSHNHWPRSARVIYSSARVICSSARVICSSAKVIYGSARVNNCGNLNRLVFALCNVRQELWASLRVSSGPMRVHVCELSHRMREVKIHLQAQMNVLSKRRQWTTHARLSCLLTDLRTFRDEHVGCCQDIQACLSVSSCCMIVCLSQQKCRLLSESFYLCLSLCLYVCLSVCI